MYAPLKYFMFPQVFHDKIIKLHAVNRTVSKLKRFHPPSAVRENT